MQLLIVDDEQLTRDSLVSMIPWRELGIESIQTAADGFQALKASQQTPPDIVLCDVMMPMMNGLQFGKKLRTFCPDCKLIFISGFADKEHLKEAIALRATRYIEKPIILSELQQVVQDTIAQCRAEADDREEISNLRERQSNMLPFLRRQMALDLVQGIKTTHELQSEYGMLYHHFSSAMQYYAAHFRLRRKDVGALRDEPQKSRLAAATQFFEQQLEVGSILLTDIPGNVDLALFFCGEDKEVASAIDALQRFFAALTKDLEPDESLSLGICGATQSMTQLHLCSRMARITASWQAFVAPSSNKQIPFNESNVYYADPMAAGRLAKLLESGHIQASYRFLKEWRDSIAEKHYGHVDFVKKNATELLDVCLRAEEVLSGSTRSAADIQGLHQALHECASLEETMDWLVNFLDILYPEVALSKQAGPKVQQAAAYIERQYAHPELSSQSIAQALSVTTIYLCALFKRETGKTIGQSIKDVRMKHAKRLLERDIKIYEVAQRVGYVDSNYFCTVFRKETGLSPVAYRKQMTIRRVREV